MILYGRDLSPFTRRIAVWCALQGRDLDREALAPADPEDFRKIGQLHPGGRVPALRLDDGAVLIESYLICDWLDETAPEGRRLVPAKDDARRDCLQRLGLAHATSEKIVALVYEKNRRPEQYHWPDWLERIKGQIRGGLAAMEAAAPETGFHGGVQMDGSDVAVVIAYQMAAITNPWLLDPGYPKLKNLVDRAMQIPAIAGTVPAV